MSLRPEEYHPIASADANAVAAMTATLAALKGKVSGPLVRAPFDAVMEQTPAAAGVLYEEATVGGVPGWWCRPPGGSVGATALLYLHGGAYVRGSAKSYRHFVSQLIARCGVEAFVPDYRLAPEHPFPAAVDDALAVYRGLLGLGKRQVAVCGDSAGGGLALVMLALTTHAAATGRLLAPQTGVVFSPWTDLALTSDSLTTVAEGDLLLTKQALAADAQHYRQSHSALDSRLSPVYGSLVGLPPVQVQVSEAEILRDDSLRYVTLARRAGVAAELHVWEGMPHVFAASVGELLAAGAALDLAVAFLTKQLA